MSQIYIIITPAASSSSYYYYYYLFLSLALYGCRQQATDLSILSIAICSLFWMHSLNKVTSLSVQVEDFISIALAYPLLLQRYLWYDL
jgi:hypothetical protein